MGGGFQGACAHVCVGALAPRASLSPPCDPQSACPRAARRSSFAGARASPLAAPRCHPLRRAVVGGVETAAQPRPVGSLQLNGVMPQPREVKVRFCPSAARSSLADVSPPPSPGRLECERRGGRPVLVTRGWRRRRGLWRFSAPGPSPCRPTLGVLAGANGAAQMRVGSPTAIKVPRAGDATPSEPHSLFLAVSPFLRAPWRRRARLHARPSTPPDGPLLCCCSCAAETRSLRIVGHMARRA